MASHHGKWLDIGQNKSDGDNGIWTSGICRARSDRNLWTKPRERAIAKFSCFPVLLSINQNVVRTENIIICAEKNCVHWKSFYPNVISSGGKGCAFVYATVFNYGCVWPQIKRRLAIIINIINPLILLLFFFLFASN